MSDWEAGGRRIGVTSTSSRGRGYHGDPPYSVYIEAPDPLKDPATGFVIQPYTIEATIVPDMNDDEYPPESLCILDRHGRKVCIPRAAIPSLIGALTTYEYHTAVMHGETRKPWVEEAFTRVEDGSFRYIDIEGIPEGDE